MFLNRKNVKCFLIVVLSTYWSSCFNNFSATGRRNHKPFLSIFFYLTSKNCTSDHYGMRDSYMFHQTSRNENTITNKEILGSTISKLKMCSFDNEA